MKKLFLKFLLLIFISSQLGAIAKEIKIVQVADLNFDGNTKNKAAYDFTKFIKKMNSSDVDMLVFTGDNIANSQNQQFIELCRILKTLNKPYYLALGENDVHKSGGIAKEDYMRFLDYNNPHQKSENANYIIKLSKDFGVIVLDGATPILKSTHGYFNQKTIEWLDETLTKNKKRNIAIFVHFPLIPPEKKYYYETIEPEKIRAVLDKHEKVKFIASGHFNKDFQTTDRNSVDHISTPSFKGKKPIWREFVINTGKNFSYTTKLVELE